MDMSAWIHLVAAYFRTRIDDLRADERGYTAETVVVIALLVALAIAVVAIIAVKVTQKANGINL
jgi:hypothetical protein